MKHLCFLDNQMGLEPIYVEPQSTALARYATGGGCLTRFELASSWVTTKYFTY